MAASICLFPFIFCAKKTGFFYTESRVRVPLNLILNREISLSVPVSFVITEKSNKNGGIAMTVNDIKNALECKVFAGENLLDREVHTACGSDMMSDVLAYVKDQSILLTGLVNAQVIRTADMMDMLCVVLVRGKQPTEEMISLANERGITLMSTPERMFTACGTLWEKGLRGGKLNE